MITIRSAFLVLSISFLLLFSSLSLAYKNQYIINVVGVINKQMADKVVPVIQSSGHGDTLIVVIDSPGGEVPSILRISDALVKSPALSVAVVVGTVASGGVTTLFSCDLVSIKTLKLFLIHAAFVSVGYFKMWKVEGWEEIQRKQIKMYKPYMTKDEMEFVFKDNRDLRWDRKTLEERINLPTTHLVLLVDSESQLALERRKV